MMLVAKAYTMESSDSANKDDNIIEGNEDGGISSSIVWNQHWKLVCCLLGANKLLVPWACNKHLLK